MMGELETRVTTNNRGKIAQVSVVYALLHCFVNKSPLPKNDHNS